MELSALSETIVDVPLKHGQETANLRVNIDAFTPEFFRKLGESLDARVKALQVKEKRSLTKGKKETATKRGKANARRPAFLYPEASALELQREVEVEFLVPHVLKGWDVTDNEVPIEPTKEVLIRLPPRMVHEILQACIGATKTVKKTEDEAETLGNTQDGSSGQDGSQEGLRLVGQAT